MKSDSVTIDNKPFPRFVSKAGKNCLFDTGIYVLANQVA